MSTHTYSTSLRWSGSTGARYRDYPREHSVGAAPAAARLSLSADAAFRGDPSLLNPEQLLVAAVSSCQLLSFLALAARRHLDVTGYTDDAVGLMDDSDGPARITHVLLRPRIVTTTGRHDDVVRAAHDAHTGCYIASSLTSDVSLEVEVVAA